MSTIRTLVRYWFVVPLLFVAVGLQLGLGFMTADSGAQSSPAGPKNNVITFALVTSVPTPAADWGTVSPSRTPSPTFTPSPTRTVTPSSTPTGSPAPSDTPLPPATQTGTPTVTPAPTPLAGGLTLRVPILMYHYTSIPPAGSDAIRLDLSVTPAQFESHLAYLRQAGYETISLKQLSYSLSQQGALPAKPIILTFDDGYRDNYEYAFPLLRQYGYTGTFFPITQPIDANHENYFTWDMVIEMHRAGMEFGSHTYRHADLRAKDVDFLVYEIVGSKEALEQRIEEPVRFFSYPSGRYDELTIRVLESAYFWGAVTTQWGVDQSYNQRFEWVRLRVRGSDTAGDLAAKLNGF